MTEAEAAWLAGLFEGEGCASNSARGKCLCSPFIRIVSTDRDVLERVVQITGHGRVQLRKPGKTFKDHWKTQWYWHLGKEEAIELMALLYPWLGSRRRARWDELYGEYLAYQERVRPPRECANLECRIIFVPGARNGYQKWCSPSCRDSSSDYRARQLASSRAYEARNPHRKRRRAVAV